MTHRRSRIMLVAAAALSMAACASAAPKLAPGATSEEPKPIEVALVKLNHDVRFARASMALDAQQQGELDAFLSTSAVKPTEHVFIITGPTALDGDRAGLLSTRLAARGLSVAVIRDTVQADDQLRVVVERYVASAPDCPDWSRISWANFDNLTSTNLGCATSADLAAMVADPHDLVTGRPLPALVGDAATLPIQRYRAGLIPPLAASSGSGAGGAGGGAGGGSGSGP
jgi:pilus assembly protein CpaD